MRCAICDDPLDISYQSVLPTTDGQSVHLTCAEREAATASRRRTNRAVVSSVVLVMLLILATVIDVPHSTYIALVAVVVTIHALANRRWWRYMVQRVPQMWRIRG